MYEEFLEELRKKYNYTEDLINAIRICIPVMISTYGDEKKVLDLFNNIRIFITKSATKETIDTLEKEVAGKINSHVVFTDNNMYGVKQDPPACYSYREVYDEDMNIIGEARWIMLKDAEYNKEDYMSLFGTPINIPYFLHELNHAYGMQNVVYYKRENKFVIKHGMQITESEFKKNKNTKKYIETLSVDNDIILEEIIAELNTQRQLVILMNKKDYNEVKKVLGAINHVPTLYNDSLMLIGEELEKEIGESRLRDYRENNDFSVVDEFNSTCRKSNISEKYINKEYAWEYLSHKCYDIFQLSVDKYKMSTDEYGQKQLQLIADAFAAIHAYKEAKYGTSSLEKYEELLDKTIGYRQRIMRG